jgi:hypothetical protein
MEAMKQHDMHAKVQEAGCRALFSLAETAKNKAAIKRHDGVSLAEKARERFNDKGAEKLVKVLK